VPTRSLWDGVRWMAENDFLRLCSSAKEDEVSVFIAPIVEMVLFVVCLSFLDNENCEIIVPLNDYMAIMFVMRWAKEVV